MTTNEFTSKPRTIRSRTEQRVILPYADPQNPSDWKRDMDRFLADLQFRAYADDSYLSEESDTVVIEEDESRGTITPSIRFGGIDEQERLRIGEMIGGIEKCEVAVTLHSPAFKHYEVLQQWRLDQLPDHYEYAPPATVMEKHYSDRSVIGFDVILRFIGDDPRGQLTKNVILAKRAFRVRPATLTGLRFPIDFANFDDEVPGPKDGLDLVFPEALYYIQWKATKDEVWGATEEDVPSMEGSLKVWVNERARSGIVPSSEKLQPNQMLGAQIATEIALWVMAKPDVTGDEQSLVYEHPLEDDENPQESTLLEAVFRMLKAASGEDYAVIYQWLDREDKEDLIQRHIQNFYGVVKK